MPPSCAVPPLTVTAAWPIACTSFGEWLLVLARTTVPSLIVRARPLLSVVPLSTSVLLPTFVRTLLALLTLPLRVISLPPPTVNGAVAVTVPARLAALGPLFTRAPLPPMPVPEMVKALVPNVCPPRSRVAPLLTLTAVAMLVSAPPLPSASVPAPTVTLPKKVLLPLSSNTPVPLFVKPCVPASTRFIVAVSLLTVIVGLPEETASVRMLPARPSLSRIQLLLGVVSPNFSWPIVRGPSRWIVSSDVMLSVLKSAMPSVPLAIVKVDQLSILFQSPPLVLSFQVPLVARAGAALATRASGSTSEMILLRTIRRPPAAANANVER